MANLPSGHPAAAVVDLNGPPVTVFCTDTSAGTDQHLLCITIGPHPTGLYVDRCRGQPSPSRWLRVFSGAIRKWDAESRRFWSSLWNRKRTKYAVTRVTHSLQVTTTGHDRWHGGPEEDQAVIASKQPGPRSRHARNSSCSTRACMCVCVCREAGRDAVGRRARLVARYIRRCQSLGAASLAPVRNGHETAVRCWAFFFNSAREAPHNATASGPFPSRQRGAHSTRTAVTACASVGCSRCAAGSGSRPMLPVLCARRVAQRGLTGRPLAIQQAHVLDN